MNRATVLGVQPHSPDYPLFAVIQNSKVHSFSEADTINIIWFDFEPSHNITLCLIYLINR